MATIVLAALTMIIIIAWWCWVLCYVQELFRIRGFFAISDILQSLFNNILEFFEIYSLFSW